MEQSNESSMRIADDGYAIPASGHYAPLTGDGIDAHGDRGVGSASIGIGMDAGYPSILGGARGAELLQLFIENL